STGLCPADYFGRTLVAHLPANLKVGVVNVSVAGTKIELFNPATMQPAVDKAPSWMKNIIAAYDGNPYQHLVDAARVAQRTGVIKGILLHQGEDALDHAGAQDALDHAGALRHGHDQGHLAPPGRSEHERPGLAEQGQS